jgi:hypothetical protein
MTGKERTAVNLSVLITTTNMEKDRNPSILEVKQCAPRIAALMQQLGYEELSAELFRAFLKTGKAKQFDRNNLTHLNDQQLKVLAE